MYRKLSHPLKAHYRGIVQCDGYAAYKNIAEAGGEGVMLAFCWAHLRRRFFDIAKDGSAPIASEALERIAALYAIEKTIRGQSGLGLALSPTPIRTLGRRSRWPPSAKAKRFFVAACAAALPRASAIRSHR